MLLLICASTPFAASPSRAAELKEETLSRWNDYIQSATSQVGSQGSFLWIDQAPDRVQRVRAGEILVSSVGQHNPKPVPSGLIHDWMGAAFMPNATVEDVLDAVRDYGEYTEFYKPTVVASKLLGRDGDCDKYSMRVVNKEAVAGTALDMEYETCYFHPDEHRWYSITRSTRVQEIRHYGQPNEQKLPSDQGSGYIWRLYSVAKFEQRDGGIYVEVEAIALSRDIPLAARWLVSPIVRRISKNSMLLSLKQTEDAVQSTQQAKRNAQSPTVGDKGSRPSRVSVANTPVVPERP
jgi:hypothetical protein